MVLGARAVGLTMIMHVAYVAYVAWHAPARTVDRWFES
jgi:hypothetical protein